jgi:isocitrate dehydrogenase
VAEKLDQAEEKIVDELASVQGSEVDIGGYYWPDPERMEEAMRPSSTLNEVIAELAGGN